MIDINLRYLYVKKSRHGKQSFYLRRPRQPLIPLQVTGRDDPNLAAAYSAALEGQEWAGPGKKADPTSTLVRPAPGSLRALCARYVEYMSKDPTLAARTKYIRKRHLDAVCLEPYQPGSEKMMGDMPAHLFGVKHANVVLDRKLDTPEARNDRRKCLQAMFKWAVKRELVKDNPMAKTDVVRTHSEGHRAWTQEHIDRFVATHPKGTKAYLAMMLLLEAGQRRGDVVEWGRQHVKNGKLHFVQAKNREKLHKKMAILVTPELQEALDTVPTGQLTFLQTEFGKPYSVGGFGNWFRRRCDEAGLKGYSAHGLRKTMQIRLSEVDATDKEMQGVAGHETTNETQRYTRARDRAKLADKAMEKLIAARKRNKN